MNQPGPTGRFFNINLEAGEVSNVADQTAHIKANAELVYRKICTLVARTSFLVCRQRRVICKYNKCYCKSEDFRIAKSSLGFLSSNVV